MDHQGSTNSNADLPAGSGPYDGPDSTTTRSPLVRAGYWGLAGSVVVTLVGTILLAQGNYQVATTGAVIRFVGTVMMLTSCIVALVGHRMPLLRKFFGTVPEPGPRKDPWTGRGHSTAVAHTQFSLRGLFGLVTLLAIASGLVISTPDAMFAYLAAYAQLTLLAILLVVMVYDRGLPRAFCIAASVPATLSVLMISTLGSGFARATGGILGSSSYRIAIALNWGMIVVIGLIGVGVRVWIAFGVQRIAERHRAEKTSSSSAKGARHE